jgi:D-xylulose reductase
MVFAAAPPHDGTLTGYYVVSEDFCYLLPATVTLQKGSLVGPLAVAIHVLKQARLQYGDSIVVFGAGAVGLLCCAVAKVYECGYPGITA